MILENNLPDNILTWSLYKEHGNVDTNVLQEVLHDDRITDKLGYAISVYRLDGRKYSDQEILEWAEIAVGVYSGKIKVRLDKCVSGILGDWQYDK